MQARQAGAKLFLALALLLSLGCRAPHFLQLDLAQPGWQTRHGQAIWKPDRDKPEIVGDLLVATRGDGQAYLQFSKALPIVSARLSPEGWRIEFPPENKEFSAAGNPPKRLVWLQLLRELTGSAASRNWRVEHSGAGGISLESDGTGERLEVFF